MIGENSFAGIQYFGLAGVTSSCKDAIVRMIQFGDKINEAKLLTGTGENSATHCFLLNVNCDELVAIKSGFSSGYSGEGPKGLSVVLELFIRHGIEVDEYVVSESLIDRLDQSALKDAYLDLIESSRPVRPRALYDYILRDEDIFSGGSPELWYEFPPVMPYAIMDSRLIDLALKFEEHPDSAILSGFRRLEDIVRNRTGLEEHGSKLFSKAFQGDNSKLQWDGINSGEHQGRVLLFTGIYMAFRNKRAHQEPVHCEQKLLNEFLLLNQLFLLEKTAVMRKTVEASI